MSRVDDRVRFSYADSAHGTLVGQRTTLERTLYTVEKIGNVSTTSPFGALSRMLHCLMTPQAVFSTTIV